MAVGKAERREERRPQVTSVFDREDRAALDILELADMAWHDCYGEVAIPETVVNDILLVSEGDLAGLAGACLLAVRDVRDLRLAADAADRT